MNKVEASPLRDLLLWPLIVLSAALAIASTSFYERLLFVLLITVLLLMKGGHQHLTGLVRAVQENCNRTRDRVESELGAFSSKIELLHEQVNQHEQRIEQRLSQLASIAPPIPLTERVSAGYMRPILVGALTVIAAQALILLTFGDDIRAASTLFLSNGPRTVRSVAEEQRLVRAEQLALAERVWSIERALGNSSAKSEVRSAAGSIGRSAAPAFDPRASLGSSLVTPPAKRTTRSFAAPGKYEPAATTADGTAVYSNSRESYLPTGLAPALERSSLSLASP